MRQFSWTDRVLAISEDRPYHSELTVTGEQDLSMKGESIFHLENGGLKFWFYINDEEPFTASFEAFAASRHKQSPLTLKISSRDFTYPARITTVPSGCPNGDRTKIEGFIDSTTFGSPTDTLNRVDIWLRGLPTGWYGPRKWTHYEGVTRDSINYKNDGQTILPAEGSPSVTALGGFTLKADGWTTSLREVHQSERMPSEVSHLCGITRDDNTLTGDSAKRFIEDHLDPFLCFVFARKIQYEQIAGTGWAMMPLRRSIIPHGTMARNWFLSVRGAIELTPLFEGFFRLPPEVKEHWRKVIYQYAASEEIMATLGEAAIAASVSFASLEGLTRSIISIHADRDQWLNKDLSLKRGKHIIEAIEWIAKRAFGTHSDTFKRASDNIRKIRNSTMHLDLTVLVGAENAYHRWNASQALIEVLLLSMMGLEQIPNRTLHGKFEIMGKDMYEGVRKEELNLS